MTKSLSDVFNIGDLREMARRRLPRGVFEFVDRGTEDDLALRNNRAAFDRIALRTRLLVDVSMRLQALDLFAAPSLQLCLVAPAGAASLLCYQGEVGRLPRRGEGAAATSQKPSQPADLDRSRLAAADV